MFSHILFHLNCQCIYLQSHFNAVRLNVRVELRNCLRQLAIHDAAFYTYT